MFWPIQFSWMNWCAELCSTAHARAATAWVDHNDQKPVAGCVEKTEPNSCSQAFPSPPFRRLADEDPKRGDILLPVVRLG